MFNLQKQSLAKKSVINSKVNKRFYDDFIKQMELRHFMMEVEKNLKGVK